MEVKLTVSESKRLIAKGVADHPAVIQAMSQGYVVLCKGTTDAYVAEELLGKPIQKTDYVTGHTLPVRRNRPAHVSATLPDLVFKDGKVMKDVTATGVVGDLGPGDVFIKGANALNYDRQQAGLLIGHPTGGTLGATIGVLVARSVRVLVPVGFEKSIPGDLHDLAEYVGEVRRRDASTPAFWPIPGELLTEIEALEVLTGSEAVVIGSGGIGGAEGGVRLLVTGSQKQIEKAVALIEEIQGEPAFLD